jgi:hypothetical protein
VLACLLPAARCVLPVVRHQQMVARTPRVRSGTEPNMHFPCEAGVCSPLLLVQRDSGRSASRRAACPRLRGDLRVGRGEQAACSRPRCRRNLRASDPSRRHGRALRQRPAKPLPKSRPIAGAPSQGSDLPDPLRANRPLSARRLAHAHCCSSSKPTARRAALFTGAGRAFDARHQARLSVTPEASAVLRLRDLTAPHCLRG